MALSKIQSESINLADDFAGMRFGGTASANELDSYEEGTYTPVISATDGIGTLTYTSQIGRYQKVGNRVSVQVYVRIGSKGTAAGNFRFTLPFTSVNVANANVTMAHWLNGTVDGQAFQGTNTTTTLIDHNASIIKFYASNGDGGLNQLHASHVGNGTDFMFQGSYEV